LDIAQKNSESYVCTGPCTSAAAVTQDEAKCANDQTISVYAMYEIEICLFCGSKKTHIRKRCPVRSAACYRCQKIGHYAKVCRSPAKEAPSNTSACITPALCAIQQAPECLRFAVVVVVFVHGKQLPALMDPGSSLSDVSEKLLNRCICPFDSNNIYYEKHVDLVECSLSRNTYITYDYDVRPSNL